MIFFLCEIEIILIPILHCLGLWLQQQQSSNHLAFNLVENVQKSFMDLVSDPKDSLNSLPNISAVFAANFVISLTELYCSSGMYKGPNHLLR